MEFKKANFSNIEIIEILKLYPFSANDVVIYELNAVANNNYRVSNKYFDIVIKVYSHGQSDKDKIVKEIEAIQLFKLNGLNVPELIYGNNKKIIQEFNGFNIVSSRYIPGKTFDQLEFTPERMQEVGKITAKVIKTAKCLDVNSFKCLNLQEEFEYVRKNLESLIKKKGYNFDLSEYNQNLNLVYEVIDELDNTKEKQFLHKDIWPWNLIETENEVCLLDFNDWAIGPSIIELAVPLLEFSMYQSDKFNIEVAQNIIKGYRMELDLTFRSKKLWEAILFICYLYFPYNVIQAETKFESEIYLKRISNLLKNPEIINNIFCS